MGKEEKKREKKREKERERDTHIFMQSKVENKTKIEYETGSRCGLNSLYHSRIVKSISDQT